jgi:hypothetical protein
MRVLKATTRAKAGNLLSGPAGLGFAGGRIESGHWIVTRTDGTEIDFGDVTSFILSTAGPINQAPPGITSSDGSAFKVGATLTVGNGGWSNWPTSYSYGWLRNGEPIYGETAQTYLLTDADAAATITATVQAINSNGSNTATSAPTPVISMAETPLRKFYIAPDGSDANPGTIQAPWLTIGKVSAASKLPGDAFLFRGDGQYTGNIVADTAGNSTDRVIYGSYGGGRAEILAGTGRGFYALNLPYLTVRDTVFTGAGPTTSAEHGVLIDMDLSGTTRLAGPHIVNCKASQFGHSGVFVRSSSPTNGWDGTRIRYCEAHDNTGGVAATNAGIRLSGYYAASTPSNINGLIEYCETYDNTGKAGSTNWTGSGIFIGQSQASRVRRCLSYRNGINQTQTVGGSYGIWGGDCIDVTFEYNISHSNYASNSRTIDGGGIDLDGGMQNCTSQFNFTYNNDGPGQFLYAFPGDGMRANTGNVIRWNISANDSVTNLSCIQVRSDDPATTTSCDVYHNTVYQTNGRNCLRIQENGGGAITGKVANNILYQGDPAGYCLSIQVANLNGVTFRGNCYAGSSRVFWGGSGDYHSVADWLATVTNQERVSGAIVATTYHPKFANAGGLTAEDYKLASGSPLVDAGVAPASTGLSVGSADYFGNALPVGAGYPMGAHDASALSTAAAVELTATYTHTGTDAGNGYGDPAATPAIMRDGDYSNASAWRSPNPSDTSTPYSITADVGAVYTLTHVNLGSHSNAARLNGCEVLLSTNGTTWLSVGQVFAAVGGATHSFALGSRPGRYIRLRKADGQLAEPVPGVAEFRPFGY